jgi:hypothetical protein
MHKRGQEKETFHLMTLLVAMIIESRQYIVLVSIWSTGGMILPGEKLSTRRKTHPYTILSTRNPTYTGLESNMGLHDDGKRCTMIVRRTKNILP